MQFSCKTNLAFVSAFLHKLDPKRVKVVIITDFGQGQKSASNAENITGLPKTLQMPS